VANQLLNSAIVVEVSSAMKGNGPGFFRNSAVKRSVAALCLFLWLSLLALTALPELHTAIHRDAASADHDCAVTAIAHGKFAFQTPAPIAAAAPQAVIFEPARLVSISLPSVAYRLAPGRAPPAA
jgi:hypothetical protein